MQPQFWLDRWRSNQIGWHQAEHNPLLQTYWSKLELDATAAAFVPLCGKTLDMRWLEARGHDVIGVELSPLAVEAYFAEANERAVVEQIDWFTRYRGARTTILQGDFFDLHAGHFPDALGVFDRGALVALPPALRRRYADHLQRIVPDGCRILLLTLEYDEARIQGPPHSVCADEVRRHYGERCEVTQLDAIVTRSLPPHFVEAGVQQAVEGVYLIHKLD